MVKKCICFQRVSSRRQNLEAQTIAVHNAALKDYQEDEILEIQGKESAIKLSEEERVTLNEMKELVEENPSIECIYFFSVDRLARRVSVVMSIKEWADSRQINLVFLNPYPFSTWFRNTEGVMVKNDISDIYLMFLAFGAKMEMQIKAERFAAAKDWLKRNNKATGKLLFGYNKNESKDIILDKEKAPIIRWVFDCYLYKGMSTTQIFNEGAELGYWENLKTRENKANKARKILMNYAYAGIEQKNGIIYPPIVDKEEVDKAITIMKERAVKPNKLFTNNIYYCKSILKNEIDRKVLVVDRNHVRYKTVNSETRYSISLNVCDSLIWQTAFEVKWNLMSGADDSQKEETVRQLKEVSTKIVNLKKYIEDELSPKFAKAYNAYINSKGRITDDMYNATISELSTEQVKTEKKIQELEKRENELSSLLNELGKREKRDVSIYTVKGITDDKQRLEIIKECITDMTINKVKDNMFMIKVHHLLTTSPNEYIHIHATPTKKRTYWLVGEVDIDNFNPVQEIEEGNIIDITESIERRFERVHR